MGFVLKLELSKTYLCKITNWLKETKFVGTHINYVLFL
ncbi:hypothetical protein LEP1GSC173_3502 [Leptospira interrogans str. HAI1594]|uniref:Uncharacterized protein n=2 Tax=Leptospira interrogans TaxID=173 RepID=M3HTY1_LEPIT|nr:hypothetical protein LEP1GSC007_3629 [Leptospira interrogans serovar Bulgarica str. Mallika]EJP14332.1 hypothetical protein LEP1GSC080_4498 [Leptospira interrogans str. FPW2026]EKP78276.1 hypothetical protein LEP1GSC173_3502 [Leptospira interrogans str. HAI1594]EKR18529.1 hypothetical protein LEP1GSC019_1348 [Leptospira interrogans serovar Pyrogenes str. 2006006960]EMF43884.1 hypothetical protein LEP1GSC067_1821 [Leptospira interrogans serovar Lora str. TE 1992]EMG21376.1 hypothetical prote